ncbi:hypothetical protein N7507_011678 [Penicillium longicatenatum]|nr:hypothetical protein N7507_011678 [Penicillium longicatenatum]
MENNNTNQSDPVTPQLNHWGVSNAERLPPLALGAAMTPAGAWAAVIKHYQFNIAVQDQRFKGTLLKELVDKPARNEPTLRAHYAVKWTPTGFMDEINDTKERVEGVRIQIVGSEQSVPCLCCESHRGIFAICFRAATGKCGNCQWLKQPCSLDPDAQPVTRKVKRKTTSQEELASARDEMLSLVSANGTLREHCRKLKASIREISEKIVTRSIN